MNLSNTHNADEATAHAVVVEEMSKYFGELSALDNVSLTVKRGSFFGLLGPNGAGKTTLIGVLGGLVKASSGRGSVLGKDIAEQPLAVRASIGIVPQELTYDPFLTVREALTFQSKYYGIHDNHEWIATLLEKLQLTDKVDINTRYLSGGMKRRLMIAQALVHKPAVIVLDEPTAGVDINLRLALWNFIRELNATGRTIILTTHYLEEAEALCDEVALMNFGKIVAQGKTRALLSSLQHSVSVRLRLAGDGELPPAVVARQRIGDVYTVDINGYADLEPLLSLLREHNLEISELSVSPPRLEDVFVKVMATS